MPRGVSLTPQARVSHRDDLSQELRLSLFEYPSHDAALARVLATSSNPLGGISAEGAGVGGGDRRSGLFSRKDGRQRRRGEQIHVFDSEGNLTSKQTGVHVFHLKRETLFFVLRSLSWMNLLSFSIVLYLFLLLFISVVYYFWGWACGAHATTSIVNSLYFTIVSLAANGGYMGEDADTMGAPDHVCYRGRTCIVMLCSYVNILFVGMVAALVVGKAEYTGALANRIEFSDFCTLIRVPGRIDSWRLAFRMANLENKKPLAHGQLRLFVVSAEPLKEYRMAKRERLRLKRKLEAMEWETKQYLQEKAVAAGASLPSAPLTAELLENKKQGGVSNTSFSAAAMAMADDPNIRAILNYKKRLEGEKAQEKAEKRRERAKRREAERKRTGKHRSTRRTASRQPNDDDDEGDNKAGADLGLSAGETAVDVAEEPMQQHDASFPLPHRERKVWQGRRGGREENSGEGEVKRGSQSHNHSPNSEGTDGANAARHRSDRRRRGDEPGGRRRRHRQRGAAAPRSPSTQSSDGTRASTRSASSTSVSSRSTSSSSTSTTNHSAKTNSSVPDSIDARSPIFESGGIGGVASFADLAIHGVGGSPNHLTTVGYGTHTSRVPTHSYGSPVRKASGVLGRPTPAKPTVGVSTSDERARLLGSAAGGGVRKDGNKGRAAGKKGGGGGKRRDDADVEDDTDDADEDDYVERVHINVSEIDWLSPGESYLNKHQGQLSLWYPATITHLIDERSPLYRFMEIPRVGAALGSGGTNNNSSSNSNASSVFTSSVHRAAPSCSSGLSSRTFQIVAVFDATEMETGATIMAKHTYTATDIVTHYKFSNKLVHMNPDSGEVLLDYHYFNEVLPITAVESSTTDSEV